MPKLLLLFSHTLTDEQIADARQSLGIDNFVALPAELQARWSNVPPEPEDVREHLRPLFAWLDTRAETGDYVLAQGDFGAVWMAVDFALRHGLTPLYSTTRRIVDERKQPDGTVRKQSHFRHVRYRRYAQER